MADPGTIVEIPFQLENGLIVIAAEVNGNKGLFLFDNGFSLSAVNQQFADKAGIQFKSKANMADANSKSMLVPVTTVDTVRFGHLDFVKTGFYQINTGNIFPCMPIDGIIGASVINKANWEIDFQKNKIRISPDPFANEGIGIDISFSPNNSTITTLQINGNPVQSKIDFGKNSSLSLRYKDVISFTEGTPVQKMTGIRASSAHGLGEIETFYYMASPVQVKYKGNELPSSRATITQNQKYSGYLGIEYFKDFLVSINSSERKYVLSLTGAMAQTRANELSYGIAIYPHNGKWSVIQKNEADSLLSKVNLLDEVLEIDNLPPSAFHDLCRFRKYLDSKKHKGESLILRIKGKKEPLEVPCRAPAIVKLF